MEGADGVMRLHYRGRATPHGPSRPLTPVDGEPPSSSDPTTEQAKANISHFSTIARSRDYEGEKRSITDNSTVFSCVVLFLFY